MIEKKFIFHTRARIQALTWESCTFSNEILIFWNYVSKNSCIFQIWRELWCFNFENIQNTLKTKDYKRQYQYLCDKSLDLYEILNLGKASKKNPDYLMTLIKRMGGYLAEITTSWSLRNSDMSLGWVGV